MSGTNHRTYRKKRLSQVQIIVRIESGSGVFDSTGKFGVLSGSWTDRDPELVRVLVSIVPGKARRKAEEVSNKILLVFSKTVIIVHADKQVEKYPKSK